MLAKIIGGFVTILVGVALLFEFDSITEGIVGIAEEFGWTANYSTYNTSLSSNISAGVENLTNNISAGVETLANNTGEIFTGASATIISLVPLFFILGIITAAVGMVYSALKSMGVISGGGLDIGDDEDDEDDEEDEEDNEDYEKVKDRIEKLEDEEQKKPETKKEIPLPGSSITEEEIIRSEFD